MRLDPEFFKAYLEFSSVSWVKGKKKGEEGSGGVLEPKACELACLRILLCVCAYWK